MNKKMSLEVVKRVESLKKIKFPKSLMMLGLSPNFTHQQFEEVMCFERSDELRKLAHKEWVEEQNPEYDHHNWRWYLSYAQMGNECNEHYKYMVNKRNGCI